MIKFVIKFVLIAILAVAGYLAYRGVTSNQSNSKAIVEATSTAVGAVKGAFKDGATEVLQDVSEKALELKDSAVGHIKNATDSAVKSLTEKKDSVISSVDSSVEQAKTTVKARIGDVKNAAKEKLKN